jgi:hypothetical protein
MANNNKAPAKQVTGKKKKVITAKTAAATKAKTVNKTTATKTAAKKSAVKKTPVKKTAATKTAAKKSAVKKTPANKIAPAETSKRLTEASNNRKASKKVVVAAASRPKSQTHSDSAEIEELSKTASTDSSGGSLKKTKKNVIEKKIIHRVEQSLAEDPMEKLEEEVRKESASEDIGTSNGMAIKSLFKF